MSIEFHDYSFEVKEAMNDAIKAFLYEAGGEIQSGAQRNTPVATGQLKGSWKYKVNESAGEVKIGSGLQNAIWNEFGTGQYALKGDGRKTPWKYQGIDGKWHTTTGKRPRRSFQHAFDSIKGKLQAMLANKLKGLK